LCASASAASGSSAGWRCCRRFARRARQHQYVAEAGDGGLEAWHRALDAVAALRPRWVVSGHKDATRPDLASDIDETRRYLDVADEVIRSSADRAGFYAHLKGRYPQRVNPYTIWLSALRLFPG
jgi:hypothetical protein